MDPVKSIKRRIKYNKSEDRRYRDFWYSCSVDEFSVMIEPGRGETVSGNMFALLKEIETAPAWEAYRPYFIVTDKTREEAERKVAFYGFRKVKLVKRMSDEYLKLLASCKYFFSDNTYPDIFCKKTDQVLANTWHGTPLKHMGVATLDGARGIGNVQRNYFMADYALFPNDFTRDIFMDDYLLRTQFSGRAVMLDYPRNDAFFDDAMRARVRREQGIENKKIYAYMPTWRGGDSKNVNMDDQIAEITGYLESFDALLKEDQLLYVNLHPFVGNRLTYDSFEHVRPFPADYETYDFLNASDALITDYSSVFFDYAQTGRSVVLFTYDLEDYMASRGMYMDVTDLPFAICRTPDEVMGAINRGGSVADDDFMRSYCAHRDAGRRCADQYLSIVFNSGDLPEAEKHFCSTEDPAKAGQHVHVIALSDIDKGINETVRNSISRHLSEGDHVTLAFDGGMKKGTVETLREFEPFDKVDFYSLIGGVRDDDMPREVRRVFPGWHIDSLETIKGIKRNYYRLARHLIPVRTYSMKDRKDSIEIRFRQPRLSYLESARMDVFDYPLDKKGDRYSITIPKEDLSGFIYRNQITAVDKFGNEHKIISSNRFLKILKILHTRVIKLDIDSKTVDDEQDNGPGSGIICYLQEYMGRTDLLVRPVNYTDSLSQRVKIGIAYTLAALRKGGTTPILLYEKNSERYEESASVLYEKLIDMGYKNAYYVINRDCPARNSVPDKYRSNLLMKYSFRHYLKLFRCRTFFATERITHNIDLRPLSPFLRYWLKHAGFNYVFLQHGVMYMVSLDAERRAFFKLINREGYINRTVVSSELEADHFVYRGNYDREELYVCGLLKFDKAVRNDVHDRIVIMPTWRPGEAIQAAEDFRQTSYYKFIEKIYNAVPDDLKDRVIVLPHPLIKKNAVEALASSEEAGADDVMRLMLPDYTHEEVLRMTDTLITDYSSISYDAFYRGANVIFDWEEKDDTIAYYGKSARLMLTEDLAFGEVAYTKDELRAAIENTYGKEQQSKYIDRFRNIVTYHDGRNTERFIEMAKKDGLL